MKENKNLKWQLEDCTYLLEEVINNYKYIDFTELKKSIANHIGVTQGSVNLAIANYIFLLSDGKKGLSSSTFRQREATNLTLEKHGFSKSKLLSILS